jgi:tetratricopeptide (TPR) repeat protein
MFVGLIMLVCLTLAVPAFSQGNENNAWQAIQDERDARRRAERLEEFIRNFQNSAHRPDADKMLVSFWVQNKDFQKILNHAEAFRQNLPSADAASKATIYTEAMLAAASLKNNNKVIEFSGYVLDADPNNLTVLILLAGSNMPTPEKALEHAQKAVTVAKPATMSQEQYATMQFRANSIVGNFHFAENKFKEANAAYEAALKFNPKDHATQFRSGFASLNLAVASAQAAQTVNTDLQAASKSNATAMITELSAKQEALEKEALAHRDAALDSLAKAVAIGGQFSTQAKTLLDNTYQSKNKSLDGEDQFIAAKKAELGLP